jgi:hypothetical protein
MAAEDDAEWKLILALEILATELRRQGLSKNRVREILYLRFCRGGTPGEGERSTRLIGPLLPKRRRDPLHFALPPLTTRKCEDDQIAAPSPPTD